MTTLNHAPDSIAHAWSITYTDGAGSQTEDRFATETEARQRVAYLADRGRDSVLRGPSNVEWITKAGPSSVAPAKGVQMNTLPTPPALRPHFTRHGAIEKMFTDCPDWCTQHGVGHKAPLPGTSRRHVTTELKIRLDNAGHFYVTDDGRDGLSTGYLGVTLRMASRGNRWISLNYVWGDDDGDPQQELPVRLYFDEARELIAVLQHLMKLGMD